MCMNKVTLNKSKYDQKPGGNGSECRVVRQTTYEEGGQQHHGNADFQCSFSAKMIT